MLQPKRVKYRRPQDGRGNKGNNRGNGRSNRGGNRKKNNNR